MPKPDKPMSRSRPTSTPKSSKKKTTRSSSRSQTEALSRPKFTLALEDGKGKKEVGRFEKIYHREIDGNGPEDDIDDLNIEKAEASDSESEKSSEIEPESRPAYRSESEYNSEEEDRVQDIIPEVEETPRGELSDYTLVRLPIGEEGFLDVPEGASSINMVFHLEELSKEIDFYYKWDISLKRKAEERIQPDFQKRIRRDPSHEERDEPYKTKEKEPRKSFRVTDSELPPGVKGKLEILQCPPDAYWDESDLVKKLWVMAAQGKVFQFTKEQDRILSEVIARHSSLVSKEEESDPEEGPSNRRR